jgi:NAD(P)H-hydrate epimerase
MNKYVSVAEMIRIEQASDRVGYTYSMMMEAAGKGLAESTINAYSQTGNKRVIALVGKGNNGGDALVALKYLIDAGWQAACFLIADLGENEHLKAAIDKGCRVVNYWNENGLIKLLDLMEKTDVIIDGLLGTGFKLPMKGPFPTVLDAVRTKIITMDNAPKVVAVDCPSGVECDKGEASEFTIKADLTVCMAAYKQGMLKFPAYEYLGSVDVVDIGLPEDIEDWLNIKMHVPVIGDIKKVIPSRPENSHKGTFGTLMIAAGSVSYTGAAWLAGNAAYRSGVGMVTLAVPESIYPILAKEFPEATWIPLPEEEGSISEKGADLLLKQLGRSSAILIGPGFGTSGTSGEFVKNIISAIDSIPMIVDADGLRLLCRIKDWHKLLPKNSVLTPHPGEMSELTGLSIDEIQANRVEIAEKFAKQWGNVVVLKGALTVVASPSSETMIMPFASSALATAGTGDVLAGLIAGFAAQGMKPFEAAYLGVGIHAQAGINAAKKAGSPAGVMAGDLIPQIPGLLNK